MKSLAEDVNPNFYLQEETETSGNTAFLNSCQSLEYMGSKLGDNIHSHSDFSEINGKQAKIVEAVRESEAKHSSMIANISDVISIVSPDGIIKYVSPNTERFFGWLPENIIDSYIWEKIHPFDLEVIKNEFLDLLSGTERSTIVVIPFVPFSGIY